MTNSSQNLTVKNPLSAFSQAPSYAVSNWQDEEVIYVGEKPQIRAQQCRLRVPLQLTERRIYCYLEANLSAVGAFLFLGSIVMRNQGTLVSAIPINLADYSSQTPSKSVARLYNSGGSPVGDSLVLTLAQPFNTLITTVTVQPLRLNGEVDEIYYECLGFTAGNITGWRCYLGCLSTKF